MKDFLRKNRWVVSVLIVSAIIAATLTHYYINSSTREKPIRLLEPITGCQYVKLLGVGINVDWLTFRKVHHYYFMWRGKGVNVAEVFRAKGFNNVRIRISGDVLSNKTIIKEIEEVVNDCLSAGLIPVITYTADEVRDDPESPWAQKHFIEWWVTVARALKDEPYTLSYDLIIESSHEIRNYPQILNKLYGETIKAIREIDKYRILILTSPNSSSPFNLNQLQIPRGDKYLIAEWHIYAGGPCPKKGGLQPYNKTLIVEAIKTAIGWSEKTGVPTWVGAWRPNCYPKHLIARWPDGAPKGTLTLNEALNFTKFMAGELRSNGISYDINADELFLNYSTLKWYSSQEQLLQAALGSYYR